MTEGSMPAPVARRAMRMLLAPLAAGALALTATGAALANGVGQPAPWQMNFQGAVTPVMEHIHWFHWFILTIIVAISLFVLGLLAWCVVKYNEKANATPSKTTHHTALEVVWTVVPVVILLVIAVPSFRLLYEEQTIPPADMTIKTIGRQWYWTYEYPDHGRFAFDSIMLQDRELKPGQPRLLAVDNEVVVPVNKTVRVQVTASDVLHAFAVPSFGIKSDAVPGRLNETWFRATVEGVYYGQCSELCGKDHAFMPIAVRVVSQERFDQWTAEARRRFAEGRPPVSVAELEAMDRARLAVTETPAPAAAQN